MFTINRNLITTAFVAGIGLTACAYYWYRRKKRSYKIEYRDKSNAILLEEIAQKYCNEQDYTSSSTKDSDLASGDSCCEKQPGASSDDEGSEVEEVLEQTKLTILKHMFVITEGMSPIDKLKVYEQMAQKINVIQRAEGIYDVKWRP